MGLVKKFWMELEEKGDWPFGLEHKKVCTHHFEDPYLNKMIEEYGEQGECSYCGKHGVVCSMQNFMEQVSWKIHMYFDDVNNANLFYADSFYDDENEVIPGFKRVGEYVAPKEAEYFESTLDLMDDLGLVTDDDELNKDIEDVFTTQEWIERDILHEDYRRALFDQWKQFANAVTHSRRYTFLATPEFLPLVKGDEKTERKDILSSLKELIVAQKLVRTLKEGTTLYRARRVKDKSKEYVFSDITAAPDDVATVNRMSPAGVSLFYASFNKSTAVDECYGEKTDALLLGEFVTKKALNVLDLTKIPGPSFWMDCWQENQFLHSFNREITKKLDPKDTNLLQYIPTQVFTEFLRYMFVDGKGRKLDGMIYGSSKTREKDVVLFCNQRESKAFVDLKSIKIED